MNKWLVLGAACVSSMLTACGGEAALDPNEGDAGTQSEPLFEQYSDMPVVDVIAARKNKRLWAHVVACGNDHKVYIRRQGWLSSGLRDWTPWEVVTDSYRCNGRPSIGSWDYSSRDSTVMIYWRDAHDHLIEATYVGSTGKKYVVDLTVEEGLPTLEGNPIVADVANTSDEPEQISVAMQVNDGTRRLYTLDFYAGSWHFRAVLRANGRTAVGMTDNFVATYGPQNSGWARPYLAMQDTLQSHAVYSRSSWSRSYTQYASLSGDIVGAIVLSGHDTTGPGGPGCGTDGCVYYRNSSGYVSRARLTSSSLTFSRLATSVSGRDNTSLAGGGPYGGAGKLFARNSAGHVAEVDLWGTRPPQELGGNPRSGMRCYLGECYYQGTDGKLYFLDQFAMEWNMGLNVLEE